MPPKHYQRFSMNSVKLQDTILIYRNLLHFYTVTIQYQKVKFKNQSHSQAQKKNKTSTCKTKKVKNCSQKIINKYKKLQMIESHEMIHQSSWTERIDGQIILLYEECNLYENNNDNFYRTKINNSKICIETQKTPNS